MIIKNRKNITSAAVDTLPIGTVQSFIGLTAPNGYLFLLGQQVSKSRYAELYALCGNLFNNGQIPDADKFYLPDLRGRTVVGLNTGDGDFETIGKRFGSKTHILSISELAAHTHIQNAHSHIDVGETSDGNTNPVVTGTGTAVSGAVRPAVYSWVNNDRARYSRVTDTVAVNKNEGNNLAHNNVQPSLVLKIGRAHV